MEPCTKTTFETKKEAKKRLAEILSVSERQKKPSRFYKCENCGKYHLTSMGKDHYKFVQHFNSPEEKQNRRIVSISMYWAKKKGWVLEIV